MTKGITTGIVSLLILCMVSGYGEKEEVPISAKVVTTMTVLQATYDEKLSYQGAVRSEGSKNYSFLTSGKIESIYVKEGQFIKSGDSLAKLDTADLEGKSLQSQSQQKISIANIEKNIESYNSQISSRNIEIENIKSEIEVQNKNIDALCISVEAYENSYYADEKKLNSAKENTEKMLSLYNVGGISRSDYEDAVLEESEYEAALSKSKASLEAARAELASAKASLVTLNNNLKTAQNELASAIKLRDQEIQTKTATASVNVLDTEEYKRSIENSTIVADSDGYIDEIIYEPGENVSANSPVIVVNSESAIVSIGVTIQDYNKLSLVRSVVINGNITGTIDTVAKYPDESSGTYAVDIKFNNEDISIGEVVSVDLIIGESDGVYIPKDSVININGINYVYKLNDDNTVSRVNIEIEKITDDQMLVKNLTDEKIVISGVQNLQENELVKEVQYE